MRESRVISILIHATQLILWGCLTVVVLLPNNSLFAQDPDDVEDVEEFFGDDEDYDEYEDEEVVVAGSSLPTHAPAGDFIFIEGSGAPKPEAPKTPPRGGGGEWTSSSSNSPFTTPHYSARSLPDLLTPEPGDSGLSTGGGGSNWPIESTA